MKPKEYIKKFGFDSELKYSKDLFVGDLAADFVASVEAKKSMHIVPALERSYVEMEEKYRRIVVGSVLTKQQQDEIWKLFTTRVYFPYRTAKCGGDFNKMKHNYRYETDPVYKKKHDNYLFAKKMADYDREWFENFRMEQEDIFRERMENFWRMLGGFSNKADIQAHLNELDITRSEYDTESNKIDLVKRKYRAISMTRHPDQGGDPEAFIRATQAKDALLKILAA